MGIGTEELDVKVRKLNAEIRRLDIRVGGCGYWD